MIGVHRAHPAEAAGLPADQHAPTRYEKVLAACLWCAPHLAMVCLVFVMIYVQIQPWPAAAAVAVVIGALQATVCAATSRPKLQLLAGGIALSCAIVARLAWGCAGRFSLFAAVPPAFVAAACLCTAWSKRSNARDTSHAVVWLAKAAFLLAALLPLACARALCHATERQAWVVVAALTSFALLGAHSAPLGRLAEALLPTNITNGGILAGSPDVLSLLSLLATHVLTAGVGALAAWLLAAWLLVAWLANAVPSTIPDILQRLADTLRTGPA